MAGAEHDFFIDKGETFERTIRYKQPDASYLNFSTYTIRMTLRPNYDTDPIITLAEISGAVTTSGIIVASDNLSFTIRITDEITEDITNDLCVYDLEMEGSDGRVTKLLRGKMYFNAEVTT